MRVCVGVLFLYALTHSISIDTEEIVRLEIQLGVDFHFVGLYFKTKQQNTHLLKRLKGDRLLKEKSTPTVHIHGCSD